MSLKWLSNFENQSAAIFFIRKYYEGRNIIIGAPKPFDGMARSYVGIYADEAESKAYMEKWAREHPDTETAKLILKDHT